MQRCRVVHRSNPNVPNGPQAKGPQERLLGSQGQVVETGSGHHVHERDVNDHGIVEIALLVVVGDVLGHFLEGRVGKQIQHLGSEECNENRRRKEEVCDL